MGQGKEGKKKRGRRRKKRPKELSGCRKSHFSDLINGEFVYECGKTGCEVLVREKSWCHMAHYGTEVPLRALFDVWTLCDGPHTSLLVCVRAEKGLGFALYSAHTPGQTTPLQAVARHT